MKTEKNQQPLPKEVLEMLAMQDQAMSSMGAMIAQLQRILWLAVRQAGGSLQLNEGEIDPLWRLDKRRLENGTLDLTATVTPPPTEEALKALADELRGTDLRIEDIQKKREDLAMWPPAYIVGKLAPFILWSEDRWRDTALVRGAKEQQLENN